MESVVRRGQHCNILQWLWHYDTMTAAGMAHIRYAVFYRITVAPWDGGSSRGTGVYL